MEWWVFPEPITPIRYANLVRIYMANSSDLFPQRRVTPLPGGYMGKILRVDLTSGALTD